MTKQTFSQRIGLEPLEKELQLESMDDRLRNGLWNCLLLFKACLWIKFNNSDHSDKEIEFKTKIIQNNLVSYLENDFFGRGVSHIRQGKTSTHNQTSFTGVLIFSASLPVCL